MVPNDWLKETEKSIETPSHPELVQTRLTAGRQISGVEWLNRLSPAAGSPQPITS